MDRKQMLAEFERLGGKTNLNAILVSIKHWKMIRHIRYWEKLRHEYHDVGADYYILPTVNNCGLCHRYGEDCYKCGLTDGDDDCSVNYYKAFHGIQGSNRKQFLEGCRDLLKELAALEVKERARLLKRKKV